MSNHVIVVSYSDILSIKLREDKITEGFISNSWLSICIKCNLGLSVENLLQVNCSEYCQGTPKRVASNKNLSSRIGIFESFHSVCNLSLNIIVGLDEAGVNFSTSDSRIR